MQRANIRQGICIILVFVGCAYASSDAQRGWFYYESNNTVMTTKNVKFASYKDALDSAKHEYEEIEARAIINPTPENIASYRYAMQLLSDRSAQLAMLTATQDWQDPNSRIAMQATGGAGLQQDLNNARMDNYLLAKSYGLFFFFARDCKYCNVEANELTKLSINYKIRVLAISMDGSSLPQFPNALDDKGFSHRIGVDKPCALVAFDVKNNTTVPVGYGYIHFDTIIERLHALLISGTAYTQQYLKEQVPIRISE